MYMQTNGLNVDKVGLDKKRIEIGDELIIKQAELDEVADYPFNVASPKQCTEYFYNHKGIKPYINRKTGRPTCDDKAMSRIIRRYGLKEARVVQEIRSLAKLKSTYLDIELDKQGRISCAYNPRGTNTGRLSSSQTIFNTGMNLQNLDPRFKSFIVVDKEKEDE